MQPQNILPKFLGVFAVFSTVDNPQPQIGLPLASYLITLLDEERLTQLEEQLDFEEEEAINSLMASFHKKKKKKLGI